MDEQGCEEDKSLIIRGISDGGIVSLVNNNCSSFQADVSNQQIKIPSVCLEDTNTNNSAKSVIIDIYDKRHDGNSPAPTFIPASNLVGDIGHTGSKLLVMKSLPKEWKELQKNR